MTRIKIATLTGAASGLALALAVALPASAQTTNYPMGTDCAKLIAGERTICEKQMSKQSEDGTVGNGGTATTPPNAAGVGIGAGTGEPGGNPSGTLNNTGHAVRTNGIGDTNNHTVPGAGGGTTTGNGTSATP
ncbi:MAG TPA: hypothetical protein VMW18_03955 [Candidatus Binatia bacterium]|nr:hypothetical protein [Candidatus Binatia bacterium]